MPYIYTDVLKLDNIPHIGEGDCVELIKAFAPGLKGLSTSAWREGARVLGPQRLAPGAAIATFVNGRYPNNNSGQHAAFFLSRVGDIIWVIDQWKGDKNKPLVSRRDIRPHHRNRDGTYHRPSNNSHAFSVIELR